ncbi:unnamed protein product, partial [Cylicostephanus goldi]
MCVVSEILNKSNVFWVIHLKCGIKYSADAPDHLFNNLKEAFDNEALIVAAIAANTKDEIEQTLSCGLVKGHAYAVTAVKYVELDANSIRMIRLQNPWGEKEWNGPWSDDSKEWEQVSQSTCLMSKCSKRSGSGDSLSTDFPWMPWYSFVQYFTDISICQLFNTRIVSTSRRYHEAIYYGEWTTNGVKRGAPDYLAGGCFNFPTFCNNPQVCPIMFALTQREPNEGSKRRDPYVTIGIHVMKVENNRSHRIHQAMTPFGISDYAGARSVFLHLRVVPAGRYIAVPTTFAPKEQTTFMLRIYSDRKIETRELTEVRHSGSVPVTLKLSGYLSLA